MRRVYVTRANHVVCVCLQCGVRSTCRGSTPASPPDPVSAACDRCRNVAPLWSSAWSPEIIPRVNCRIITWSHERQRLTVLWLYTPEPSSWTHPCWTWRRYRRASVAGVWWVSEPEPARGSRGRNPEQRRDRLSVSAVILHNYIYIYIFEFSRLKELVCSFPQVRTLTVTLRLPNPNICLSLSPKSTLKTTS